MPDLSASDRGKLAKILGMLSSTYEGERASAGLLATRFVKDRDLTWDSILQPPPVRQSGAGSSSYRPDEPPRRPRPSSWRTKLHACLNRPDTLSVWEADFLASISRRITLTAKQLACLNRIYEKVAQ